MGEYYVNGQLFHHGVKGMKWGRRRYQNSDGSLTAAGRKRYGGAADIKEIDRNYRSEKRAINKTYDKEFNAAYRKHQTSLPFTKRRKEANAEMDAAGKKFRDARDAAKEKHRVDREAAAKAAVKKYDKMYDDAAASSDKADAQWAKAKEMYKSLGRTPIERIYKVMKNTPEAQKYSEMYDRASRNSDIADQKWTKVKSEYKNTGRNFVNRVVNNVKYGS